jgi:glycosyltransferase involved in cell wall biosynthesis
MNSNSILTVCIITYNHEDFIVKALESVLNQITEFDFQIVIADDFSTDNTRGILEKYKSIYSDKITLIFQKENVGAAKNWHDLISFPKTKYIAYLEGDDYWIDSNKLQKQVDFLEQNIDYSMCFHNATESSNGILKKETFCKMIKVQNLNLEDFMFKHIVPSASILFRNNIEFPEWTVKVSSGDKLLIFLNAINGKIHYMKDVMSHYNVTDNGESRSVEHRGLNKVYNMAYLYAKLDEHTNYKFKETLKRGLNYEINVHLLEPYRKELKTSLLIKEIFIRILIKWFKYKRKS